MTLSENRRRLLAASPLLAAVTAAALLATTVPAQAAALSWTATTPPDLGEGYALRDVTALAADDVWAVGATGVNGNGRGVAIHWDGRTWTETPTPASAQLLDVELIDGDLWTVGALDGTAALTARWDGDAWVEVPAPTTEWPEGRTPVLSSVDGAAADDVWAAGSGIGFDYPGHDAPLLQHWDGEEWQLAKVPLPDGAVHATLSEVTAVAADDVWAVGQYLDADDAIAPLLLHWDGHEWTPREMDLPETSLHGVTATDDGRVWLAASTHADSDPFAAVPVVVVGDGETWKQLAVPAKGGWLSAITPTGDGRVAAVGTDGDGFLAVSATGTKVRRLPAPAVEPGTDYSSLEGVAVTPETGTLWTVGFLGKLAVPVAAHTA